MSNNRKRRNWLRHNRYADRCMDVTQKHTLVHYALIRVYLAHPDVQNGRRVWIPR